MNPGWRREGRELRKEEVASVIVPMIYFNADPLPLRKKRSGTKLERTSLSTDVF